MLRKVSREISMWRRNSGRFLGSAHAYETRGRVFKSPRTYHNHRKISNLQKLNERAPAFAVTKRI